jgi:hypothetical protein
MINEMHYVIGSAPRSRQFGTGRGPVFLGDVRCDGTERNLLQCSNTVFVGSYCPHVRDVGATCERECRLLKWTAILYT